MSKKEHKAGFVSIIGKPNVGKSTLMNQLVGERLSIITSKAQTTRHRIFGIISGEDFQIVYSDTPGMIKPNYALQSSMMRFVNSSLEDADIVLMVTDLFDRYDDVLLAKLHKISQPVVLVLNKIDLDKRGEVQQKMEYWKSALDFSSIVPELFQTLFLFPPVFCHFHKGFEEDLLVKKDLHVLSGFSTNPF